MAFTHLEVHSNLTLLGATPSIEALASRASADGFAHLALTDTNALYGAVAFARACRTQGVQPLIGMTVTLQQPVPGPERLQPGEGGPGYLVLLAKDAAGYRSLCRLSTLIQGRPDRETIAANGLAWEQIAAHRAGLICLSGGRMGWVDRFLRAGEPSSALAFAGRLAGTFDEDAYLTLELHQGDDAAHAAEIAAMARRLGMPLVAVQPVYCLSEEEAPLLRLLAAIRLNRPLDVVYEEEEEDEEAGEGGSAQETWTTASIPESQGSISTQAAERRADVRWLNTGEMSERFRAFPTAMDTAGEIAKSCGEALRWHAQLLPRTPGSSLLSVPPTPRVLPGVVRIWQHLGQHGNTARHLLVRPRLGRGRRRSTDPVRSAARASWGGPDDRAVPDGPLA